MEESLKRTPLRPISLKKQALGVTSTLARTGFKTKKKKPRRKSVASDPTWKEICALWSKIVRAPGKCVFEGMDGIVCSPTLNCMHLKSRRFSSIHCDPLNTVCGCVSHHYHFTNCPDRFYLAIETLYPGRWDELQAKWLTGVKPKKHEYKEIYDVMLKQLWTATVEAA